MSMGSNPMFPNIKYNDSFAYVINHLNIATSHKKLFIDVIYTKKNLFFLSVFKKNSIIQTYYVFSKNNNLFIRVYPFYFKNLSIMKSFKILSSPSRKFFISLKSLSVIKKRSGNAIYLLSTSKGVLSLDQALKLKIGGFLLGFCFF